MNAYLVVVHDDKGGGFDAVVLAEQMAEAEQAAIMSGKSTDASKNYRVVGSRVLPGRGAIYSRFFYNVGAKEHSNGA